MRRLLMQIRESETLSENYSNLVKQNGFRMTPKAVKQKFILFRWILNRAFCPYFWTLFLASYHSAFSFLPKMEKWT